MTLRARCIELIRSNPAFTRADVEALVRAWDEERGKQRELIAKRVNQLVYLAQDSLGLPRRVPPRGTWSPPVPAVTEEPAEVVFALSEEERLQELNFFLEVQRRWVAARTSADFIRWLDAEIWRVKTERLHRAT